MSEGPIRGDFAINGLIRKVPRTRRYQVTDQGRLVITVLLAAAQACVPVRVQAA